jgi:hypothetical protein
MNNNPEENTVATVNQNDPVYEWCEDDDRILKEWVDKSACFKWLHNTAYKKYKKEYLRFMIPVIVISTLTGAANFALNSISDQTYRNYAGLVVGSFNIVAAMISTVAQFLKTAELKEGHNIAGKSWDKFNRLLKIELQRNPRERSNKKELFNVSIKEFDRLVEMSPDIPTNIINQFKELYSDSIDLIKPEITGAIISSKIYEVKEIIKEENINKDSGLDNLDTETKLKNVFIENFKSLYNRKPTADEINDHFELLNISIA